MSLVQTYVLLDSIWVGLTSISFSIVTFRMVVFRPFVSEVMLAKVKSSDEDGIRRTLISLLLYPNSLFSR